jgi:hypothetical protein
VGGQISAAIARITSILQEERRKFQNEAKT